MGTIEGSSAALPGAWVARGPGGWSQGNLVVDPSNPDVLYATSRLGLFGSLDAGRSWRLLYSTTALLTFPPVEVADLAIDPRDSRHLLLLATDGLVSSLDGGATWRRLAIPPVPGGARSQTFPIVAIDPFDSATLCIVGYVLPTTGILTFGYLYKSVDGGQNWASVLVADPGITGLVLDRLSPGRILAGVYGGASFAGGRFVGGGVVSSVDGGATWLNSSVSSSPWCTTLVADPSDSRILYAEVECVAYKSADIGRTWQAISSQFCVGSLVPGPSEIFANTYTGVLRNRQGSVGWESLLPEGYVVVGADPRVADVIYARRGSALLKSTDGGLSFVDVTDGLKASVDVRTIVAAPGTPTVVYAGGTGEFFVSVDAAATWIRVANGLPGTAAVLDISVDPTNSSILYAAVQSSGLPAAPGGVFKSLDGGSNWSLAANGLANLDVLSVTADFGIPRVLYAATALGVFRSDDRAENWRRLNLSPNARWIRTDPTAGGVVYAASDAGVFKSKDSGESWRQTSETLLVRNIEVDPFDGNRLYAVGPAGVFRSADAGTTWSVASLPEAAVLAG